MGWPIPTLTQALYRSSSLIEVTASPTIYLSQWHYCIIRQFHDSSYPFICSYVRPSYLRFSLSFPIASYGSYRSDYLSGCTDDWCDVNQMSSTMTTFCLQLLQKSFVLQLSRECRRRHIWHNYFLYFVFFAFFLSIYFSDFLFHLFSYCCRIKYVNLEKW